MKVLLLQTRRQSGLGLNGFIRTEPLGLEVVAASLKGHHVRILDLFDDRELSILQIRRLSGNLRLLINANAYLSGVCSVVNPGGGAQGFSGKLNW